jgi:hypothetical protein
MRRLDIRGERETSGAYLKLEKIGVACFSNMRGKTTRSNPKRAKESSHDESVDWSPFVIRHLDGQDSGSRANVTL